MEDVYELFDHPREIAGLVWYMPVPEGEDPDETIEERWGRWVEEAGRRISGGGR